MVVNVTNISQKMKSKILLNIQKKMLQNGKERFPIIITKYFNPENFAPYKGKYKKLVSFVLVLEKFPNNKQKI